MARPGATKRLLAALQALQALDRAGDPLEAIAVARRLREAAEDLERAKVDRARQKGVSWREIGSLYDMSKQAAQQRFREGVPPPAARPAEGGPPKRRSGRVGSDARASREGSGARGRVPARGRKARDRTALAPGRRRSEPSR